MAYYQTDDGSSVELFDSTIVKCMCACGYTWEDHTTQDYCPDCGKDTVKWAETNRVGYFYAFGLPGCLWDSDSFGPFESLAEALEDMEMHGCDVDNFARKV